MFSPYSDKSKRESAELRSVLDEQREAAHLSQRDNDALTWNVKRLTSERDVIVSDRVALEENILGLKTVMADLKEECNNLRVRCG